MTKPTPDAAAATMIPADGYAPPRLTVLGSVVEMTAGGTGTAIEPGTTGNQPPNRQRQ